MKIKEIYTDKEGVLIHTHSWADYVFAQPFSVPLARLLAHFRVNPNHITLSTIPFAVTAAILFATNHLIFGAIFFFISYILDTSDGMVARLTNRTTELGSRLDNYTDVLNNFCMYVGLWYSQFFLNGEGLLGFFIIFVHYLIVFLGIVLIQDTSYKTVFPKIHSYYSTFEEGVFTFFFLPIFGLVRVGLPIAVGLTVFTHIILIFVRRKNINNIRYRIKKSILRWG